MSLIKCTECGGYISDQAVMCVHCGCPEEIKNVDGIEYIEKTIVDEEIVYVKITATLYIQDWLDISFALEQRVDYYKKRIKTINIDEIENLSILEQLDIREKLNDMEKIYFSDMQETKRLSESIKKMLMM